MSQGSRHVRLEKKGRDYPRGEKPKSELLQSTPAFDHIIHPSSAQLPCRLGLGARVVLAAGRRLLREVLFSSVHIPHIPPVRSHSSQNALASPIRRHLRHHLPSVPTRWRADASPPPLSRRVSSAISTQMERCSLSPVIELGQLACQVVLLTTLVVHMHVVGVHSEATLSAPFSGRAANSTCSWSRPARRLDLQV
jgi:hypothetical protein